MTFQKLGVQVLSLETMGVKMGSVELSDVLKVFKENEFMRSGVTPWQDGSKLFTFCLRIPGTNPDAMRVMNEAGFVGLCELMEIE
jgi:hypothetical protein